MAQAASVGAGAAQGAAAGAAFGPWGAVIGGVIGAGASLLGGQKAAPQAQFNPVDVTAEQAKAIAGNGQNFDAASALSRRTNDFNQSESARLLEKAIPGFSALQQKLVASANSDLNSQTSLPADVQNKLEQYAAEKGISRGTSGNFNGFSLVKDFGFNLIDWQQAQRARALNTLSTVFGMAPRVNPMSPMSMMVDPNTAIQVAASNNGQQFNSNQAALNAQTAAGNYNRSLLSGAVAGIGASVAGGFASQQPSVQPKATAPASISNAAGPTYASSLNLPTFASTRK